MADNVSITPGTGAIVAADECPAASGILVQRTKTTWGPDGTANDVDVATGKPMPVQLRNSTGELLSDTTGVLISTTQVISNKLQTQTNGATASRVNAAASTNATSLKASTGNIYDIDVFNVAAYDVFLKLYNKASAPTVGTDTPVFTIPLKAGTGYSRVFQYGRNFATGIAYAITKLQADSDTTVVVAGDVTGSIGWI